MTISDPHKLSFYVWYVVTTHFCLRGGEIQVKLKKSDLVFSIVDGEERIHLATDFMTKNHYGGLTSTSFTSNGCIEDERQVAAVRKYLDHRHPACDRLFQ